MECAIEKPATRLLSPTGFDSDTWVAEVKRIGAKRQPLTAAGLQGLRDEHTRTIEPARARAAEALTLEHTRSDVVNQASHALAAEALTLERTISDLVNQAYALTPAEIALMWQTAPPRMPSPPPG